MTLVRLNRSPKNELARLHGEMDDLFDSFFRGLDPAGRGFLGYKAWPAVDVAEKDDAILVRAEVPGCRPEYRDFRVRQHTHHQR